MIGRHYRALLKALDYFVRGYRTGLSVERARASFLRDIRSGYTPEQTFRLAMQAAGHEPGSENYALMREMVEGFAREAGVGWDEVRG